MLVVLSVDRLIAVSIPLKYFGFNRYYAYKLLAVAYGYCIGFGSVFIILAIIKSNDTQLISASCYLEETLSAVNRSMALYYMTMFSTYGIVSVVVFFIMGVVNWRKTNITISDENLQERERQFQRRVTKSVTVSCFCTFTFAVVPSALGYGGDFFKFPRLVTQLIWLLPNLNPGCNVIIFLKRQPEILEALKAMIKCKQMPIDIRLWKANAIAQQGHTTNNRQ